MSEYTNVERPFLDKLREIGWKVIDKGACGIPQAPAESMRNSFDEIVLKEEFYRMLSTSPWGTTTALSDKLAWVKLYFDNTVPIVAIKEEETNCGNPFYKKVIFSHHKNLCLQEGSWLIEDRDKHGAKAFGDRHIQFGTDKYPDWKSVVDHLKKQIKVMYYIGGNCFFS